MNDVFESATYGRLTYVTMREKILAFLRDDPSCMYRIIIGTDSSEKEKMWDFITAIVVHRIGRGGVYFWRRVETRGIGNGSSVIQYKPKGLVKERIYREAALSLETADVFLKLFKNDGISKYDVEIHVDVGNFGDTREMIHEVVGMIRGSGFICKTKPYSYGASKIADRHT